MEDEDESQNFLLSRILQWVVVGIRMHEDAVSQGGKYARCGG